MKNIALGISLVSAIALSTFTSSAMAHQHGKKSSVTVTKLSDSVYLFSGKGGNIGASVGEDGTFLVDNKFAENTSDIIAELKKLGSAAPKFVLNTHWHADHSGGNDNLSKEGSVIVAHENVRKRLKKDNFIKAFNRKVDAYPESALPRVTFTKDIHFHMNGDKIKIFHIANAHTDGDSVTYFKTDNILHTGDLFFNGFYPFIDVRTGGSVKGMINATGKILEKIDDQTKIIPGHGPLANKADLKAFHEMLAIAYKNLKALKDQGKSLQETIDAKPLKELEAQWGNGIFTSEKWISVVFNGLE